MVLLHKDKIDNLLLEHFESDLEPTYESIKNFCDNNFGLVQFFSKSESNSVKYKTKKGWLIKLEKGITPDKRIILKNFVALKDQNAVWVRQQDTNKEYVIGTSDMSTFRTLLRDHYDVVAYYYSTLVSDSELNIVKPTNT